MPDDSGALLGDYQDSDDLRLVRLDRDTGERTVVAAVDGHSLDTLSAAADTLPPTVFASRRTGEVIAARFTGDRPQVVPIDPHFAEVQAALETARPTASWAWVSSDRGEQRWVATFVHDREPADDVVLRPRHRRGPPAVPRRRRLDPAALAPTTAVGFPARDGLPLHGFLTLPVGVEPRNLPLVLLVHGGTVDARHLGLQRGRAVPGQPRLRRAAGQLPRLHRVRAPAPDRRDRRVRRAPCTTT